MTEAPLGCMDEGDDGLQEQAVTTLLRVVRSKISEGDGENALAALLHALRLTQGEDAIVGVLESAKKRVDEEATSAEDARAMAMRMSALLVADTSTLLYERGQEGLLKSAFEDGSSVVCSACDSLVPRARFQQHQLYWCEHATGGEDDLCDDDDDDGGGDATAVAATVAEDSGEDNTFFDAMED